MRVREQLISREDRIYGWNNSGEYCTVHETGNTDVGANAQRHADLQSGGNVRQASWHEQVDDSEAVISFPPEAQCWHAGDGEGPGNLTSYSIEICVNADGDYNLALANAAQRVRAWRERTGHGRDRVVTHQHWSGKNCPSRLLASGRWQQFLAATDPDSEATTPIVEKEDSMVRMVSPVRGYVTQHYRAGAHLGIDIGTGGQRRAVHAAFAGRVVRIVRGRKHGQPASRGSVLAPGRSGNGVVVQNPDGERQLYNHVTPLRSLRVGQNVSIGQRLGTVDMSGITTGLHLHFEIWNAAGRTRNPMIDFRHFGVSPGAAVPNLSAPASGGSSGSSGSSSGSSSVLAYQRRQNRYGDAGLYEDGVDGPVTQNWRTWVRDAQRRLNAFRSSKRNLRIDGDYGRVTHNYVRDVQRRNGLYQDGILGPVMVNWMRSHGSAIKHRPPNRP